MRGDWFLDMDEQGVHQHSMISLASPGILLRFFSRDALLPLCGTTSTTGCLPQQAWSSLLLLCRGFWYHE